MMHIQADWYLRRLPTYVHLHSDCSCMYVHGLKLRCCWYMSVGSINSAMVDCVQFPRTYELSLVCRVRWDYITISSLYRS